MSTKAGHTAGPCAVVAPSLPRPRIIGAWICTVGNNIGDPAVFSTALGPHGELLCGDKLADATLIADAFTVAHETGLTPRQLAEQRKELLTTVKDLLDKMEAHKPLRVAAARRARATLAKAEGGAA